MYEAIEPVAAAGHGAADELTTTVVPISDLLALRAWSQARVARLLSSARRDDLVVAEPGGWRLTAACAADARRVVRNHRLWEAYLIAYADVAPSHVDRDADLIEHVLGQEIVTELEQLLAEQYPAEVVPPSPHAIEPARA
jgi:manganese/zinc/iron transport system permease protein